MRAISLTVNGTRSDVLVEPRTHLADLLREQLHLTGTHLGCEQGVCGACTVLIDGKPMRSCIAFAVACDGSDIRTIEGFDGDPIMGELREAFSEHHGLQCGFCTPGMLITSRDIVKRFGETDEATIRRELSGNLCRCTGYVGIVRAVSSVSTGKAPAPEEVAVEAKTVEKALTAVPPAKATPSPAKAASSSASPRLSAGGAGWTELGRTVRVEAPPDKVWESLKNVEAVATCLPGASIESYDGRNFAGVLAVKFGPIKANFGGDGSVAFEDAERSGVVEGGGSDKRTGSQVRGKVGFTVNPDGPDASTIDVSISYRISGPLAQFARGALVQNFVNHLASIFAGNLGRLAAGRGGVAGAAPMATELSAFGLAWGVVKAWFADRFRRRSGA